MDLKSSTEHSYYPLLLDISRKLCIVLGGGKVAERKAKMLLKFNAHVKVVSPVISKPLKLLAQQGKIKIAERRYRSTDLRNVSLVFAATNDENVNYRIKKDAKQMNILVNVVDNPHLCDFIVPSIINKGPVIIAISTSGLLPLLSKKLRKEIDAMLTDEYMRYARTIGMFRRFLIDNIPDKKMRSDIMGKISKIPVRELNTMGLKKIKRMFLQDTI